MTVCALISSSLLPLLAVGEGAQSALTPQAARMVFETARQLSQRDGGRLWGLPLYGPMLIADPSTRRVIASVADGERRLAASDGVYTGTLPDDVNIANTAVEWAGVHWTMLRWPLPAAGPDRNRLVMHELWHRVQRQLDLPANNPDNSHLDTPDGRLWMRLEWRALIEALENTSAEQLDRVRDAMTFRAYRHRLFPKAAAEEGLLECNEGLAEYTGIVLAADSRDAAVAAAVANLRSGEEAASYVRSFAYATGPAYGLLLDRLTPDWRVRIRGKESLTDLVSSALAQSDEESSENGRSVSALDRAEPYGYTAILAQEREREDKRQARIAQHRQRFVDDAVLRLPLRRPNVAFDPATLEPVESLGTVYPTLRLTDEWGVLEVAGGAALMSPDWTEARVPAAHTVTDEGAEGNGWILQLESGWRIVPGKRKGDLTLRKP